MVPYGVGVLGATGMVGQRLVQLLTDHPWFELRALAASERSAGRTYGEAVRWRLSEAPPPHAAALSVVNCRVEELEDCDLVFSGLDAEVARDVEPRFVEAGFSVVSNSSALRGHAAVPLVIPEVNPGHLDLLAQPRETGRGIVVTNPNCSTTGLALVLAPLHRALGVRRVVVTTFQAISGAGHQGPRALDLVDNVVPFIPGEEEKIERELGKILGRVERGAIVPASITVSAHCHRVATVDGHLEAVSMELEQPAPPEQIASLLAGFRGEIAPLGLPSAPERPIVVRAEPDRPQPRLDRDCGGGMSVVVGRIRRCPVLGTKLELLSHNTVRGAAGGTLLNAELLAANELLPRRVPPCS